MQQDFFLCLLDLCSQRRAEWRRPVCRPRQNFGSLEVWAPLSRLTAWRNEDCSCEDLIDPACEAESNKRVALSRSAPKCKAKETGKFSRREDPEVCQILDLWSLTRQHYRTSSHSFLTSSACCCSFTSPNCVPARLEAMSSMAHMFQSCMMRRMAWALGITRDG